MRTYEESLQKRMGQLCANYMLTKKGAQMTGQQLLPPNYANKHYSAQKMRAAGVSKPLQTFQSLISTGVTPTVRPALPSSSISAPSQLSKEIPAYKRRTPVYQRPPLALTRNEPLSKYKQPVPTRQVGRFSFAQDTVQKARRSVDAAIKKRKQERAAIKQRHTHNVRARIGLGLLLSNAFRPQQPTQQPTQQQQPVQRQAPVQQRPVMAQQQRTVPQYTTVQRAQVVSPYQAGPSVDIAGQLYNTHRDQLPQVAKMQPKQYHLHTMQTRSPRPNYGSSTRQINT